MTCQLATAITVTSEVRHVDQTQSSDISVAGVVKRQKMPKPCMGKPCRTNAECAKIDCPGKSCFHAIRYWPIDNCHGEFREQYADDGSADHRHRLVVSELLLIPIDRCADIVDAV